MIDVFIKKASYDYDILKPIIFDILDKVGGEKIDNTKKVLIKPNFLLPAEPKRAVLTHPSVVKAVLEYVIDKGAKALIADSPAVGTIERIFKTGGYKEALTGLNFELKAFSESVKINTGEPFGNIEIAKDAMEADIVINLPKLKTHSQMLLTLGVKNTFGCIVGLKKPQWHLRSGIDREMFANLLVKIHKTVNPSITILDAIMAMEGEGPAISGTPRHIGVIMGCSRAPELDITVCNMLSIEPDILLTNKAAKSQGIVDSNIEIHGDFFNVDNFKLPQLSLIAQGPKIIHSLIRKYVLERPDVDFNLCKLCKECLNYCPPQAISKNNKGQIQFDYDKCIRCYCCIEVCPEGALHSVETLPAKIGRFLSIIN